MKFKCLLSGIVISFMILIFSIPAGYSATYYVKNGGNDNANGLSDATAWATIAKINDFAESPGFSNGDIIQFKRGSTWSEHEGIGWDGSAINWGTINGLTIQDYGSGALPRINGNTARPVFILGSNVSNLVIKNLDVSGMDWTGDTSNYGNVSVYSATNVTIDGIYLDGHEGAVNYQHHASGIRIGSVAGDIEVKNCTVKNLIKPGVFQNSIDAWGENTPGDYSGILMYFNGGKTEGSISIHDNTVDSVYADAVAVEGFYNSSGTVEIYNNVLTRWGEDAVDSKGSIYFNIYNNEMAWYDFGYKPGETYWGATVFIGTTSSLTSNQAVGHHTFHDNYVHDSSLGGIRSNATLGLDVYNNYFKDVGNPIILDEYVRNQRFTNNLLVLTADVGSSPAMDASTHKAGATVAPGVHNNLIANNTFYISSSNHMYGIYIYAGADVEVKNNIIQMTRNSSSVYPLYSVGTGSTISYNDYYNPNNPNRAYENGKRYDSTEQAAWISAGHTGAIFSNPMFTNAQAGDFSLLSGSPCILPNMTLGLLNWPLSAMPNSTNVNSLAPPKGLSILIGTN